MPDPFAPAGRAGPLLLTSGFDGVQGDVTAQCEAVYARIIAALGTARIVRLDHFTGSQDWLAERQMVRARHFGQPAPVASTGVAARHAGTNMLTAAAIGLTTGGVRVAVPGVTYGMPAIATAMHGGPFLFVSGILTPPGNGGVAGIAQALDTIAVIARTAFGSDDYAPVRIDAYVRDATALAAVGSLAAARWDATPALTGAVLPFAEDRVEVTALFADSGVATPCEGVAVGGGVVFTGAIEPAAELTLTAAVEDAVATLGARLRVAGRGLRDIARIEVCLADPARADDLRAALARALSDVRPALLICCGGGLGGGPLRLAAVAA